MSKRWYVVHVYSGMEKSVHKALNERIERAGLQTSFGRILVPSEEVVEVKGGQKSITERRIFPGYVLVEMDLTDETWHLVKNTNRVTGFLGGSGAGVGDFFCSKYNSRIGSISSYGGRLSWSNWFGASSADGRFSIILFGMISRPADSFICRAIAQTSVFSTSPSTARPPFVSPYNVQ